MTKDEELRLQDALSANLFLLKGAQQALWHVREDCAEYPMCQLLAESIANNMKAIIEAMPSEWQEELPFESI